jgi:MoxR-like ATPase
MIEDLMGGSDLKKLHEVRDKVNADIKAHENVVDGLLIALFTDGHVLLEANPGLGKTTLVKAFARALGLPPADNGRIQFTPDLMPADITGTLMPDAENMNRLSFVRGPIFKAILLADEINRATPKTQSAMLEAMAERQVTVLGQTRRLPSDSEPAKGEAAEPFIVIATQNPIDQEGTYELPEAQTDRFMFKFIMEMPPPNDLRFIVTRETGKATATPAAAASVPNQHARRDTIEWIARVARTVRSLELPAHLLKHISNVVFATNRRYGDCEDMGEKRVAAARQFVSEYLDYPLGPRAAIQLGRAAKGYSTIKATQQSLPEPTDNLELGLVWAAVPVLRHRLKFSHGWFDKARKTYGLDGQEAEAVRERLVRELLHLTVPAGAGERTAGYARLVEQHLKAP